MMTVAIAQTMPRFLDVSGNFAGAVELIAGTTADLYVFPELFLSGYAFATDDEARSCALPRENSYFDALKKLSLDRDCAICGGYAEDGGHGDLFNSAFLIAGGQLLSNYRKTHLYYRETQFFTPGDTGFSVVEFRGVRLGMMICFDWIFPEATRSLAMLGAQVILHPANLVLPYCQRAMFARAVENRVFVATANRVGTESNSLGDTLTFTGGSQVVSPAGEYVLTFDETETAIRTVRIDPAAADDKVLNEFNTLIRDRRPEFYVDGRSSTGFSSR